METVKVGGRVISHQKYDVLRTDSAATSSRLLKLNLLLSSQFPNIKLSHDSKCLCEIHRHR